MIEVEIEKKLAEYRLSVSFRSAGGILGILGAGGSGKSMTCKCIAGIEKPDRGRIAVDDRVLFDGEQRICLSPQKRHVGYLFQNYALFPNMTVEQNLCCVRARDQRQSRQFDTLVELLQIGALLQAYPGSLSGGQQQRVAIARMLLADPALVILDEPFSAVDSHLREALQIELRELMQKQEKQAILITHSRDEAYSMCDQLLMLKKGEVVACGETHAIFNNPPNVDAAILSGCKNILRAVRKGEHEIYLPDFDAVIGVEGQVPQKLQSIGIRAHDLELPKEGEQGIQLVLEKISETPFEWNLLCKSGTKGNGVLWWKLEKSGQNKIIPRLSPGEQLRLKPYRDGISFFSQEFSR